MTHMYVSHEVVALLWTSASSSSFLSLLARKREILKVLKEKQKEMMAVNKAMSCAKKMAPPIDDDGDGNSGASVPDYGEFSDDIDDDMQLLEAPSRFSNRSLLCRPIVQQGSQR